MSVVFHVFPFRFFFRIPRCSQFFFFIHTRSNIDCRIWMHATVAVHFRSLFPFTSPISLKWKTLLKAANTHISTCGHAHNDPMEYVQPIFHSISNWAVAAFTLTYFTMSNLILEWEKNQEFYTQNNLKYFSSSPFGYVRKLQN